MPFPARRTALGTPSWDLLGSTRRGRRLRRGRFASIKIGLGFFAGVWGSAGSGQLEKFGLYVFTL